MTRVLLVCALVVGWACAPAPRGTAQPVEASVLLIVVDTLRADFLDAYGHPRSTMPEVQRHLVDRGVVFDRAFAPASWTLPSMVGLFSGRRPGRDLGDAHPAAFRFPDDRPTPAELLLASGRATAAFVGNPLLGPATGFDRGFETFWVAESSPSAMDRHGGELTDRALEWFATQRSDQPFFLWLHYIDPHDPYEAPELVRGLDPNDTTYRGSLTGRDVHTLFTGRRTSAEPERDARFLASLYEGEIRHVDGEIGRLLEGLGPRLDSTLVVFASDHGEEFYEHRGWKHGRTVFEEQLQVPLVVRWDGELPAGHRIDSAVSLLDVIPTLAEAFELEVPGPLDGSSLLARARGDDTNERVLSAAHFHTGPGRPSARLGRHKLVLFDRDAPSNPESPLDAHLLADERSRLPRLALFDLEADPGEQTNLASSRPELVDRLALLAFDGLDRPGRQIVVLGLPTGSRLTLEIALDGPAPHWERLFLGGDDTVAFTTELAEGTTTASARLVLTLSGDGLPKAVSIAPGGLPLRLLRSAVELGSGALGTPTLTIVDGEGQPPVLARRDGPVLATWQRADQSTAGVRARDPELERALRSLGYTQ